MRFTRHNIVLRAGALACVAGLALPCVGQESRRLPTVNQATTVVTAGARYANRMGNQGWLLGKAYRDLWATPIEVEVLDVDTVAGGLTPVLRVGGMQTPGLALRGADGNSYTFRTVDKRLTDVVPEEFRGTGVETVAQDQVSSSLPGAALVVARLDAAAGVLSPDMRLVVMPDDERLAEYREEFAGLLGVFYRFPTAGFGGATEVMSASDFMDVRQQGVQADSRALLRAHLIDLLVGDWDRHYRQWRWARIPGAEGLQPIPEDRDQAMSSYDGLALDVARFSGAQVVTFDHKYPSIDRLTMNAADFDRALLTDLERQDWQEIAGAVSRAITDEVIAEAVHRLPAEYVELRGADLQSILRARRDGLEQLAVRYYQDLARRVDVWASSNADRVSVDWLAGEGVQVSVAAAGSGGPVAAYYTRRFLAEETEEVRIYLDAGDDRVNVVGRPAGGIRVRVIGGPGDNVISEALEGSITYYADPNGDRYIGAGDPAEISSAYSPLVQAGDALRMPGSPPRDWGRVSRPVFAFGYHFDPGTILGGGIEIETYGFGKVPWAGRHRIQGAFAFDVAQPLLEYSADLRREGGGPHFRLLARLSGLDHLRYYGVGNETPSDQPDSFYAISNQQATLFGAVAFGETDNPSFAIGPVVRYSTSTRTDPETLLAQEQPYGSDTFGEAGLMSTFDYDSRDSRDVMAGGIELNLAGSYYPELWDAQSAFGTIEGRAAGHVELGRHGLFSLFAAGKKVLGEFPFFEAAYLGGEDTFSPYHWNRYAGDGLARAGAEIMWVLGQQKLIIPGEIGVAAGIDVGRVFVDNEESSVWHPASSVSLFYAPFSRLMLLEVGVGWSRDNTIFLMQGNMSALMR